MGKPVLIIGIPAPPEVLFERQIGRLITEVAMENPGNGCGTAPKLCPSAQPGMDNCRVLGGGQQ